MKYYGLLEIIIQIFSFLSAGTLCCFLQIVLKNLSRKSIVIFIKIKCKIKSAKIFRLKTENTLNFNWRLMFAVFEFLVVFILANFFCLLSYITFDGVIRLPSVFLFVCGWCGTKKGAHFIYRKLHQKQSLNTSCFD